ncbi:MAG TPA: ribosome-associated translation inhibitor RaiA [Saprospiraceae bacterium]|nr:ribosome-associated translation inhibitor RaiA [Saprospiraceae bacterium]HMQ81756.1 ribosome-associated translation inhibitor RaiA [Saprospiraceae bacterium]
MNINIQSVHFAPSEALNEKIRQKLEKSFHHYPFITHAEVFLKLQDNESQQKQIMEIKLELSNGELFAESRAEDFYKGLDQNIEKLKRQLEKYKDKAYSHR